MARVKKPVVTLWRVVGGIVMLVFFGVAWIVFSSATARPAISVDYGEKIEALSRSYQTGVETEANRYGEFSEIIERVAALEEEIEGEHGATLSYLTQGAQIDTLVDPDGPYGRHGIVVSQEDADAMHAFFRALDERGVIDDVLALADARHVVYELPGDQQLVESLVYIYRDFDFGSFAALAGSLRTLAVAAAESGDAARSIRSIEAALVCVRMFSSRPFHFPGIMATASEGLALLTARELVCVGGFDEAQLLALSRVLDEQRPLAYEYAIESERLALMDVIQRCYTDEGDGDGYLLPSYAVGAFATASVGWELPDVRVLDFMGRFQASRAEVEARMDEFFKEASAVLADVGREMDTLDEIAARVDDRGRPREDMMLHELFPSYLVVIKAARRNQIGRSATETVIELERRRIAEGVYPATLDGFGASAALIYRVDEGGAGFTLYSVGNDGVDNGGDAELDRVFVPVGG